MKKDEKGIAIITLVVAITVLMVLAMVIISEVDKNQKQTESDLIESELIMVQNAVLQKNTNANISQTEYEELPGENIPIQEVKDLVDGIPLKGADGEYKVLDEEDLREIGITNTTDTYIVNYKTCEVMNKDKFDFNNKKMYVTAKD